MRSFGKVSLAVLAAALVSMTPEAMAESSVIAVDWTWDGSVGYDWSQWPNATHVTVDASQPTNTIWLDEVETPDLHIEAFNLQPEHTFLLQDAAMLEPRLSMASAAGVAVFWNVPAIPWTLELTDTTTGEHVTFVVLALSSVALPMGSTYKGCGSYSCYKARQQGSTPQPSRIEHTWAASTENVAASYTTDAVVQSTSCASRAVSLDIYVSGGTAAAKGTVGGKYTYTRSTCDGFSSQGSPTRVRYSDQWRRDWYSDGSFKIYGVASGDSIIIDGADPGIPRAGIVVSYQDGKRDPFTREVTENGAGGAYFVGSYGAQPFGYGAGTQMAATGTGDNKVKVTITPPADGRNHQYTFKFLTGDNQVTGLIGFVWKDY